MDRKLTEENMITWRSDESPYSTTDLDSKGRVKFITPEGIDGTRKVVSRSTDLTPLALSFGDFFPWAGDWSEVVGSSNHEARAAAPTSVVWIGVNNRKVINGAQTTRHHLEIYHKIFSWWDKIEAGSLYAYGSGDVQLTPALMWDPSTEILNTIQDRSDPDNVVEIAQEFMGIPYLISEVEECWWLNEMTSFQGDRARVKVSANPYGGDTHADLAAVHAEMQAASTANSNSAMPMHNYTVVASLPTWGSDTEITFSGGLGTADEIRAWYGDEEQYPDGAVATQADDRIITAPDVALDDMIDIMTESHTKQFPLFVNKNVDGGYNRAVISYYQPHLLPGGDNYSAKILAAAGGYQSPNGFISSSDIADLSVTSAGVPIRLPDVTADHAFWADGIDYGLTGSYGITDLERPVHEIVTSQFPAIKAHYTTGKIRGDGAFSLGMYGYGYNDIPGSASDWPVIMYHINPKLKHALGTAYSVANSVFIEGSQIGLEVSTFTQPFMSFQWEDYGGNGANYEYDLDMKGYRYKYQNETLLTPKAARMDSRKAAGGFKPASLYVLPYVRNKFKLWVTRVDSNGIMTTAGRFDAMTANDTGLTETTGGALFTTRPDANANIYVSWTSEEPNQVIGRFTLKVI